MGNEFVFHDLTHARFADADALADGFEALAGDELVEDLALALRQAALEGVEQLGRVVEAGGRSAGLDVAIAQRERVAVESDGIE